MSNGQTTTAFLATLDDATTNAILDSIAKHYDSTRDAIRAEVCADEAESLLDYMAGGRVRLTTRVLMQQFNARARAVA